MRWRLSTRADPAALPLANRHYPRQNPDSDQFVAPGSTCVLTAGDPVLALWVTLLQKPEYTDHAWPGAWNCAAFRNEGAGLSSELIREAVAATMSFWRRPPPRRAWSRSWTSARSGTSATLAAASARRGSCQPASPRAGSWRSY